MRKSGKPLLKRLERHPAGRPISVLLPKIVKGIEITKAKKLSKLGKLWASLVGEKCAKQTSILKFVDGTLFVKVNSAPLLSALSMQHRYKLTQAIKKELPSLGLTNIVFRR